MASAMFSFLLTTLALLQVCYGAVHNVGDASGWTAMGNVDYDKWASSKNFRVGDSLVFNYNNQFHNVKQVSHQDFASCDATSPVAVYPTGSDFVTLNSSGHYYFLCGFPGHCDRGQKLHILVVPFAIRGPSPTTSPSPAPSPADLPTGSPTESETTKSASSYPRLAFGVIVLCLLISAGFDSRSWFSF